MQPSEHNSESAYKSRAVQAGRFNVTAWHFLAVAGNNGPATNVVNRGVAELVWQYGEDFYDSGVPVPKIALIGTQLQVKQLQFGPTSEVVGIRLGPMGLRALSGMPACEITNQITNASDIIDPYSLNKLKTSVQTGLHSGVIQWPQKLRIGTSPPRAIAAFYGALRTLSPGASVSAVASALGVTQRTLERQASNWLGATPKQILRIERARRTLPRLEQMEDHRSVALDSGYFDQSHMSNEIRALTGMRPRDFIRRSIEPNKLNLNLAVFAGVSFSLCG